MMSTSLFDVATGKIPHLYEGRCPDYVNGPESRDPDCPACQAISAAEAQQAGPVRPKVSFIPSVENMPMARSIDDEMMDLVDRLGALEPVDPRAWKHLLVYAPKTDPVRLTRVDIEKAFAQAGLKPEDYREDGEILPLVIAIESATLRKNGIEVAE